MREKSNNILSQFDGPVTFTSDVRHKGKVKIKDDTDAGDGDGALVVEGGVGIGKSLSVGGDLTVDGTFNLDDVDIDGAVDMATTLTLNAEFDSSLDVDGSNKLRYWFY